MVWQLARKVVLIRPSELCIKPCKLVSRSGQFGFHLRHFFLIVGAFLFCHFFDSPFRILCKQDSISFYVLLDNACNRVAAYIMASIQLVANQAGESQRQVQRYIRLTELIPELLNMVDEKKIALNPAYELSFLKKEEQTQLLDAMDSEQATPSLSQAQRLKKFSQEGRLSIDVMRAIMGEEKKSDLDKVTFTSDTLRKYFPKSHTPARMQETIMRVVAMMESSLQKIRTAT